MPADARCVRRIGLAVAIMVLTIGVGNGREAASKVEFDDGTLLYYDAACDGPHGPENDLQHKRHTRQLSDAFLLAQRQLGQRGVVAAPLGSWIYQVENAKRAIPSIHASPTRC